MLALGQYTLDWMLALLLPLTRVSAFLLAAPIFPQSVINARIRIAYSLFLCMLIFPAMAAPIRVPAEAPPLQSVFMEVLIGLAMALCLQVVSAAVALAGEQISQAVGLGFAQAFDPTVGSTPVLSQMLNLVAMLVFLAMDGHVAVVAMVSESLRALPPGSGATVNLRSLIDFCSVIFTGAVLISAPVVLALLAVNLGVGALSRATPSLNVFSVGFAISLIVGLGMLFLLIPVAATRMAEIWRSALSTLQAVSSGA